MPFVSRLAKNLCNFCINCYENVEPPRRKGILGRVRAPRSPGKKVACLPDITAESCVFPNILHFYIY